jgi:hypothetical protein
VKRGTGAVSRSSTMVEFLPSLRNRPVLLSNCVRALKIGVCGSSDCTACRLVPAAPTSSGSSSVCVPHRRHRNRVGTRPQHPGSAIDTRGAGWRRPDRSLGSRDRATRTRAGGRRGVRHSRLARVAGQSDDRSASRMKQSARRIRPHLFRSQHGLTNVVVHCRSHASPATPCLAWFSGSPRRTVHGAKKQR